MELDFGSPLSLRCRPQPDLVDTPWRLLWTFPADLGRLRAEDPASSRATRPCFRGRI